MKFRCAELLIGFLFMGAAHADTQCTFEKWALDKSYELLRKGDTGAYIFTSSNVQVDADGAPNAYHPDDVGLDCIKGESFKGLDCPANGGYPNQSWWRDAILPDPLDNNKGYIQKTGKYKGYFVSQTSLHDNTKPATSPERYVNASVVPYIVFPGKLNMLKGTGTVGDFGFAFNLDSGKSSAFIVAEVGPTDAKLGEMSIALGVALGGNPNPRTGAGKPGGTNVFIVFPHSRMKPAWPISNADIANKVNVLLEQAGGLEMLKSCAKKS